MAAELTPKQARFVDEYLVDLNATQAAIRAGYSAKTAQQASSRLLLNVVVASEIAERREKLATNAGVTVEKIISELAKLGFSDIRKAIKWNGHLVREEDNPDGGDVLVIKTIVSNHVTLLDSDDLDDDTAAAIAQISQNATGGISLKMHDKRSALVDLGKHLGMFTDKLEVTGKNGGPIKVSADELSDDELAAIAAAGRGHARPAKKGAVKPRRIRPLHHRPRRAS